MRRHSEFEKGYHNEKIEGNEKKIHKFLERMSKMTKHYWARTPTEGGQEE